MATKDSNKLITILENNISKKDDQKAKEAAARQVKSAQKVARVELSNADEAVDSAKDAVENAIANPSSTLAEIMTANRNLSVAVKNFEDMTAIFNDRF